MAINLDMAAADFEPRFRALLEAKRESALDVDATVAAIIADVRARGDAALVEYTLRFDRVDLTQSGFRIGEKEVDAAVAACDSKALRALEFAHERVLAYHRRQIPSDVAFVDALGVELGWRWRAVDSVGLYVPGGVASYPSSVIMNAAPAKVAGCRRIAMVVPRPDGKLNPLVLAAARIAGVSEIYRLGGAQAIAALAYGTASVEPVAKIVGPGNAYVAAAKRRVFGVVGIDMIAGPSEVVVLADSSADPRFVAADLLAQAEHDEAAQSILITDDAGLARAASAAVEAQLAELPRARIAGASWRDYGAINLAPNLAEGLSGSVRNAGAIFIGPHTPEAIGDYVGGSNHVLPTSRSARFSSGLGVFDFLKRTSILKCDAKSLAALGPFAVALGEAEGLHAHARSVAMRLSREGVE
jgi:histidinol dehydrogenase